MNPTEHANTLQTLKLRIWDIAGQDLAKVQAAAAKASVTLPVASVSDAEAILRRLRKQPKRKPAIDPVHKQRYIDAYRDFQAREFPRWAAAGHTIDPDIPNTAEANGLQKFIVNYLLWMGHNASRINVQGVPLRENGKITGFRPTTSHKGIADVSATVHGRRVQLEIKVARDKPSPAQLKEQARERKAGGVYEFIHSVEEFFGWYDHFVIFEQPK